ncbi:MAG: ComEC/Rec2 family competence protein [Alphaproteobacteria bacterium]
MSAEPDSRLTGLAVATGIAAFAVLCLWKRALTGVAMCAFLVLAGFGAAQLRTLTVDAPVLSRETGPVLVSAQVQFIEPTEKRARLTLVSPVSSDSRHLSALARLRVHVRNDVSDILPGDLVRLRVLVRPPPAPSLPGGFDFARKAYFERIGAVGFALGDVTRISRPAASSLSIRISRLRHDLTARILAAGSAETGPVAAALLTGERRAIPKDVLSDMRDSGLAHLLAISGLHIGLVAGLIFFVVRLLLACIEPVALRYPIKKIAAGTAVAGAFAYLVISGATIPTQRAFLMVTIFMVAVMLDRTAISLRLVALAAAIILILSPEALLSASFQMSFAAVIALVAAYEFAAPKTARLREKGGVLSSRLAMFVAATILTTVVASLATAPFAVYHFNRVALFGLLANMLAVPMMAMWIMPTGLLSMLLMPLGLESWGLTAMGWGLDAVLAIAAAVADLPNAVALVRPMPVVALATLVLGGLWLCIWRGNVRLLALPVLAAAAVSSGFVPSSNVLIDRDARFFAVNLGDGRIYMSPGRAGGFEREMWRRRLAVGAALPLPDGIADGGRLGCDDAGCIVRFGDRKIAVIVDPSATFDCGAVDRVVLLTRVSPRVCRGSSVLVSKFHLWRDGAHAIRFTGGGPIVETVREERGDRPWSRVSPRKTQYLRTSPTNRP